MAFSDGTTTDAAPSGRHTRAGYGTVPATDPSAIELQQLTERVSAAERRAAAAERRADAAEHAVAKLTRKDKCTRILGAAGCLAFVVILAFLIHNTGDDDSTPSPCAGHDEGVYANFLKTLNLVAGRTIDLASDVTVLFCNAAGKQFSEISQACFQAMSSDPSVSIKEGFFCETTVARFHEHLKNVTATAEHTGSGNIDWEISITDTAGGAPLSATGVIGFTVAAAARTLRGLIAKGVEAASLGGALSSVASATASGIYNAASAVGSVANTTGEWLAWAAGY